jgi:preprotein translocase subunit SecF
MSKNKKKKNRRNKKRSSGKSAHENQTRESKAKGNDLKRKHSQDNLEDNNQRRATGNESCQQSLSEQGNLNERNVSPHVNPKRQKRFDNNDRPNKQSSISRTCGAETSRRGDFNRYASGSGEPAGHYQVLCLV